MGVQPRSFSMTEDNAVKSPSMMSATSPVGRKRRYMDVVLINSEDAEEDAELTQRVSFKRSKSGEAELRIEVRDSVSSEPATPKSGKNSPSDKSSTSRPNMSASQTITLDMLRPHFEKPLAQVAQVFGICVTLLKKICRKNGLARWPHRQIIGLRKSIASMEQAISHFEGARRDSYAQQLDKQRNKLTALLEDPTKCNLLAVDDEYLPNQPPTPTEEYARPQMATPMHQPVSYYPSPYDSYAPAPAYEQQHHHQQYSQSYAPHPGYYHHAAPPPMNTHHVASYPVQHFYPTPYSHALAPTPQSLPQPHPTPVMALPPLRADSRPALPSLAALMGRRW